MLIDGVILVWFWRGQIRRLLSYQSNDLSFERILVLVCVRGWVCGCVRIKPNPKIGKLNKIGLRKQRCMHTMFEWENLYYFENHSIGHIEFSTILYSARRHPTKLSEAYPSPYICRYALRRRRDLDFGLHRHIGFWEHLHFIVIFPTLYVLWILDIGSHASLFWDSDTHSTIC